MARTFEVRPAFAAFRQNHADASASAENATGSDVWKLIFDLVCNLSEVVLQNIPSFWKVAKGYMEGKYQKVSSSASSSLEPLADPSRDSRRTTTRLPLSAAVEAQPNAAS